MKQQVKSIVFHKELDSRPTWKDIKHIDFQDEDEISCEFVEPYVSENNSWDSYFIIEISRMVEETDEQEQKRIRKNQEVMSRLEENRRSLYLKLKKEFEK